MDEVNQVHDRVVKALDFRFDAISLSGASFDDADFVRSVMNPK